MIDILLVSCAFHAINAATKAFCAFRFDMLDLSSYLCLTPYEATLKASCCTVIPSHVLSTILFANVLPSSFISTFSISSCSVNRCVEKNVSSPQYKIQFAHICHCHHVICITLSNACLHVSQEKLIDVATHNVCILPAYQKKL